MENTEILICDCNSLEHQIAWWYNDEWNELYAYVHLVPERNLWQRFKKSVKYFLGYKSKYGEYDQFILNNEDIEKLKQILEQVKK